MHKKYQEQLDKLHIELCKNYTELSASELITTLDSLISVYPTLMNALTKLGLELYDSLNNHRG